VQFVGMKSCDKISAGRLGLSRCINTALIVLFCRKLMYMYYWRLVISIVMHFGGRRVDLFEQFFFVVDSAA